jgi:predicted  nucleic acid-binding Zn-ribbon protein
LPNELARIESLLSSSLVISRTLEMRLEERTRQVASLQSRLTVLEQTNSEQSTELVALKNELATALHEQSELRSELETWQSRSDRWRSLAAQLRMEQAAISISLASSAATSIRLSRDFASYKQASEATILALRIEVWVYRGVAIGAAGYGLYRLGEWLLESVFAPP